MIVGVVADSASALEPDLAAANGVVVVPLTLDVAGAESGEGTSPSEKTAATVYDGATATSGPSPGSFLTAIEEADRGDGVVVLTVDRRFSSSSDSARVAAAATDRRVEVVDTGTAAGGEALVVLAVARAARAGLSLDALVEHADYVSGRVRLVAAVGDLTQLARSGRLPRPLASLGNAVGVHPVFELARGGTIRLLRPGLSERAARDLLLETWRRSRQPGHRLHVAAMHAGEAGAAAELLDAVAAEVTPATSLMAPFGPAMVAHTGPEIRGLAWWWEPIPGGADARQP